MSGAGTAVCVVAITGEAVKKPTIVRATEGFCISALLKDNVNIDKSPRISSGKVNALKEALKGEDIEKIKSAQSELMTSAQKIGEALYAQQGAADAAGAAAGASGAASNGGDDDVVDAEVVDDDDKKDNK